jgi:RNA polymerase sigma-70 factor (ECF subfamily)
VEDWAAIVARDGPAAWRTACRVLGNRDDAAECVQDAFAAAVEISRTQPVRNWRALLVRLTTTRAIDRLRRRMRREAQPIEANSIDPTDPSPDPGHMAEDRELVARLRELIPTLPGDQAEAVILHAIEEWTYEQIGRELSLSPGAVGMLLVRARQRLRESLAGDARRR